MGDHSRNHGGGEYRSFGLLDAYQESKNGIDIADVVGSFSERVSVSISNGFATFEGRNKTTLQSFSGQNILRHDKIVNPTSGRFATHTQIYRWRVPIPEVHK